MREPAEAEREAILQVLRDNSDAFRAEFERHEDAVATLREQQYDLLVRAKAAGVSLRAMSKAAQINRPALTRMIDDALARERDDRSRFAKP